MIADPLAEALEFLRRDGTYARYDQAVGGGDDEVTEADVHIANRIIARMGSREEGAILGRADRLASALAEIPAAATLADGPESVPWVALSDLFESMRDLPGIGLARATKVLHKKRPALIPILDEVVQRYLLTVEGPVSGNMTAQAVSFTRAYQREMLNQLSVLRFVASRLKEDGYELTECRLLDIYLWAYSGMYEPLWRRVEHGSSSTTWTTSRQTATGKGNTTPPRQVEGVAQYVDSDNEYLAWLIEHPAGFVLNCARRPTAAYLKLHRSSCPHLNRTTLRNWTISYQKLCADNLAALEIWSRQNAGGPPDRCPVCQPS